jgi:hypothetical protein
MLAGGDEDEDALGADEHVRRLVGKVPVDVEVGQQHRSAVVPALEGHASLAPDGAVGAVAAHQIACSGQRCPPRGVPQRAGDPDLVAAVRQQLGPPLHRQPLGSQVRHQGRLDLSLAKDEQEGIRGVVGIDVEDRYRQVAAIEVQLHPGRLVAAIEQCLGDPNRPQHLEGARLDDQGS